ncbi:MAG TPA: DUF1345 domain-containing protein [Chitinophagaceae bacterium]|nr:DUF1345 domain-containing protein [Chitinophagaceae bacterium]
MHPIHRILISAAIAAIVFLFIRHRGLGIRVQLILLWDVFAICFLGMAWIVLCTRSIRQVRDYARQDDGSRAIASIMIIGSSFASMFMVLLLILSKDASSSNTFALLIAVIGVLLAWIMVHTVFTFHYANMFYDDDAKDASRHAAGLEFPGGHKPDYFDFAYFSFVIGMTFQVSDVEISSRRIRHQVLVHSLLAFALNTFVVALAINVIAGLKG